MTDRRRSRDFAHWMGLLFRFAVYPEEALAMLPLRLEGYMRSTDPEFADWLDWALANLREEEEA